MGAIALAVFYRKFSWRMLFESARTTVEITAMVFAILLGATAFSMAFTYTGGDVIVEEFLLQLPGEQWGFLIFSMLIILALGFFIDFVEISFIVVPILAPVAEALASNENAILEELNGAQGDAQDLGGYYWPNTGMASHAMRPSATLNGIVDSLS